MMKLIVLVLMISYAKGRPGDSLDEIVDSIFQTDTKEKTTTKTGDCKCVPYYLCINGTVNKFGESILDYRINNEDHKPPTSDDDNACSYLEICCKVPEERPRIDSTPLRSPPTKLQKCGIRNPEGIGFRIPAENNDNKSQFGEFPWMLAVLKDSKIDEKPLMLYHGGASLIHPQVALTAAHLFHDTTQKFKVRAGEWDSQTKSEIFPHQDRDVVSIIVHPEFNAKTAFNDFALLFLNTSFQITDNVDVVCLPAFNTRVEAGTRCFTSGWGKNKFGKDGKYQSILRKLEVPIVDDKDCQEKLRDSRVGPYFELSDTFICAGGEPNLDTCKGDGGGPLVCPVLNHPGVYEQYGIVSWGVQCGTGKLPGVYSAVSKVVDWIEKEMKSHKLNLT